MVSEECFQEHIIADQMAESRITCLVSPFEDCQSIFSDVSSYAMGKPPAFLGIKTLVVANPFPFHWSILQGGPESAYGR